jgi:hypothetical protein
MYLKTKSGINTCPTENCEYPIFPSKYTEKTYFKRFVDVLKLSNGNKITELETDKNSKTQLIEKIRKQRLDVINTFPECIKVVCTSVFQKEISKINSQLLKSANTVIDYKKACTANPLCPINTCSGRLEYNKCNICEILTCPDCNEIKKDTSHKCSEAVLANLKEIAKLHKCPTCKSPIYKYDGCSYLTCAICDTKFNHVTNELSKSGGHTTKVALKTKISDYIDESLQPSLYMKIIVLESYIKPVNDKKFLMSMVSLDDKLILKEYKALVKTKFKNKKINKDIQSLVNIYCDSLNIRDQQ